MAQVDIESAISELEARLEAETDAYAVLCEEAADAEADWKAAYWRATVELAASSDGRRTNEKLREAEASLQAGEETFRLYRLTAERQRAGGASLASLRARLDAYRTLSANVRYQT